jgi:DNA invertase Pin-like site-specific DNA recombinase
MEHSLLAQTTYFKELIESDPNAEFAGIYADKKSGKDTRHRPQFTEMIKAARRGEIDYIVTKSISRFARNLVETLKIIRELREKNVGVYFEKESIDTLKSTSDFMLSIYATVAESELTSMGDNVKWSARKRFSKGSVELTNNLYGYEIKHGGKEFIIVEAEAAVVREVFTRYAGGEGQQAIAHDLNERGVRKRSGVLWRSTDISRMISYEKYVGDALLQKTYIQGARVVHNKGELPQYYVEGNHEAIIDRETYLRANERLAVKHEETRPKNAQEYSPFSGKLICGHCGRPYVHRKNNRNTPYEKWIWSDVTFLQYGRKYCGGHSIREKDLKEIFLSAYNEAARFEDRASQAGILADGIKDLLTQERELIALKVKGYISREAYGEQHGELLKQIKDTEAALLIETRRTGDGKKYDAADCFSDNLAASLEQATIKDYTITFKFKNGAEVIRLFNNDTDRKETWNKKLGRAN